MGQVDRLALTATVRGMPKLKWLQIRISPQGNPYYGATHVGRASPWKTGCCIATGDGIAILFYGGRFITGIRVTDPKRDQERFLNYANLLLHEDSRNFILSCIRLGQVPGEGVENRPKKKGRAWKSE